MKLSRSMTQLTLFDFFNLTSSQIFCFYRTVQDIGAILMKFQIFYCNVEIVIPFDSQFWSYLIYSFILFEALNCSYLCANFTEMWNCFELEESPRSLWQASR